MSKMVSTLLLFLINYFPITYCQSNASLIQSIIDQTNLDSLTNTVAILSGAKDLAINDTIVRINTRYRTETGKEIAADYLKIKLESWGLEVYDSQYSATGRNIYVIQEGYLYPDQYYIICAHYDSFTLMPELAPGADDNASGVATVLEAARILRDYDPAYSIIYALWDEEEGAGYGSLYFAEQALLNNMDILAVINIDMIGWDGNNDNEFEIHLPSGDSFWIAQTIIDVNSSFSIDMVPYVYPNGYIGSDHYSFILFGYEAILYCERFIGMDFCPGWHRQSDKIGSFNMPYFYNLSKLSIGTLAVLAFDAVITDVKSTNEINDYLLEQNYPNPFNPTTKIRYQIPELSFVTLTVYDVLGNEISIIVNEEKPAGSYKIYFDGDGLSSGIYFYRIKAGSFVETKKMVLMK